jgi:hypothetical protein
MSYKRRVGNCATRPTGREDSIIEETEWLVVRSDGPMCNALYSTDWKRDRNYDEIKFLLTATCSHYPQFGKADPFTGGC